MRVALILAVLAAGCASGGPSSGAAPAPSREPLYDGEPISHWVGRLHDLNEARSDGAVAPLASFCALAVPHLADGLRSERDHVRANAAHALYNIALASPGTPGIVPLLLAGLDDPFYGVRFWSVGGLGEMRPTPPEAKAALERMLKDPRPGIRESAEQKLETLRKSKGK